MKDHSYLFFLLFCTLLAFGMEKPVEERKLYFELLPREINQEIAAYDAMNRLISIRERGIPGRQKAINILAEIKLKNPALLKNDFFVYQFLNELNTRFMVYDQAALALYIASLGIPAANQWLKDYKFMHAVLWSDSDTLKKLIQEGANVNAEIEQQTPLIKTVKSPHFLEKLKQLVALGADINARNKHGRSALMEAVGANNLAAVNYLLEHGARATLEDAMGRNALFSILSVIPIQMPGEEDDTFSVTDLKQIITLLLKAGIDVNALDGDGKTVLQSMLNDRIVMYSQMAPEVIEFLKSKGAR